MKPLKETLFESKANFLFCIFQLIGICFEVHDTWRKQGELKKEDDKDKRAQLELELQYEEIKPTSMDIFHYAFCYIGVLTGKFT